MFLESTILGNPLPVFTTDHKDKVMLRKGISVPSFCLKGQTDYKYPFDYTV